MLRYQGGCLIGVGYAQGVVWGSATNPWRFAFLKVPVRFEIPRTGPVLLLFSAMSLVDGRRKSIPALSMVHLQLLSYVRQVLRPDDLPSKELEIVHDLLSLLLARNEIRECSLTVLCTGVTRFRAGRRLPIRTDIKVVWQQIQRQS